MVNFKMKEMKARSSPIVKQLWLLLIMNCLYSFGITLTQQLTTMANMSLQLLPLKSSIGRPVKLKMIFADEAV